ncbi:MAG: alkaline shock response membrane anchor protein AmaP [Actinomycetota bacterium]|nr:alkaline shock response membrane anchor protein AmaP [Actinomycetota bacterium]
MKIFNRIVIILLLVGVLALGVTMVIYSLDTRDYRFADLPRDLRLNDLYEGLNTYVGNIERGLINALDIVALSAVALLGLVLLVLELKPPSPRRVRMQQGTYVTRRAVESEIMEAVEQNLEVLQSNVKVKAQRRPGAKVNIRASVRPEEAERSTRSEVQDRVQRHLDRIGIPVSNLKVRLVQPDPRQTKTRVK